MKGFVKERGDFLS